MTESVASNGAIDFQLNDEERDDLESAEPIVAQISYASQDFDIEGLVRRMKNGDIEVPSFGSDDPDLETAGFQRGFVWTRKQMDRFIESLLLGYPIPGLFLVRQQSDKRYLVLDGQQRLRTLEAFYSGIYAEKVFALTNVADEFKNLTYSKLPAALRRTLDNSFIQATVVSTDGSPTSLEAVYQIFERLNSGGTQLTPHEIRIALYAGPFIAALAHLNENSDWRSLYGSRSPRLRDQELLVRILALYVNSAGYSRPLKSFLNDFVGAHRLSPEDLSSEIRLFESAVAMLASTVGAGAFRKSSSQVNAAKAEALLVGLMRAINANSITDDELATRVDVLESDAEFDQATSRSTADEAVVTARLTIATNVLSATT